MSQTWAHAAKQSADSYRRMIDGIVAQLSDAELHRRPTPTTNSVAIILRHLGGNLQSRWTDFVETDGEKEWRDRDAEFQNWTSDRAALLNYFDQGWSQLLLALEQYQSLDENMTLTIRGETHTAADAMTRSLTHISYHVGQMALIARIVHEGEWQWLTIAPGSSSQFNQQTWGTAASRGVFGEKPKPE